MNSINPIVPGIFPISHITSGFTTRCGGVSLSPFNTLNLGYGTTDDQSAVRENHSRLFHLLGINASSAAFMEQVHGDHVTIIESGGVVPASDGIITIQPGILLGVKYADCIPLLLYDPVRLIVAVIHCGWRPLVNGIAEKALNIMTAHYESSPVDILAAMGPSAGVCCYEIGDDIAGYFNRDSVVSRGGRLYADLWEELRHRLLISGVDTRNIEIIPHCTVCNDSLYFSHRRDGHLSGRMVGYIMMNNASQK